MLKSKIDIKEFEKLGFKKCKGCKESDLYYLCVARDSKVIFVSPTMLDIQDWERDDPRIHDRPNCKYRDMKTTLDIL